MKDIKIINKKDDQFQYLGRWVNKEHFRAFVYNDRDEQRLADNYKEFESLIASGIWFAEKPVKEDKITSIKRKLRDGNLHANG